MYLITLYEIIRILIFILKNRYRKKTEDMFIRCKYRFSHTNRLETRMGYDMKNDML
jgi:hypothetical protein